SGFGFLSSFRHSSFVIRHSSFVIRHSSFVIRHSSFVIQRLMQIRFMVPMRAKNSVGALHEPAVPERGSATRSSVACCKGPDWAGTPRELRTVLRLTEARSGARVCDPQQCCLLQGPGLGGD